MQVSHLLVPLLDHFSHSITDDDEAMPRVIASRSQQSVIPPHSAGIPPSSLNEFMGTRPRRSASLSDTLRKFAVIVL